MVGRVEVIAETHQTITDAMGFALLYPSYQPTNAFDYAIAQQTHAQAPVYF